MKVAPGKPSGHMIDILFTLALFCVFAASSLMVVLIGAGIYQGTMDKMEANFDIRTSVTYVATKIRQNDMAGAVFIGSLGDSPALVLEQQEGGAVYQTWIYHFDGALMEVLTAKGNSFEPVNGQRIMEITSFDMEQVEEGLFQFTSTDEKGRSVSLLVSPRSFAGEGAAL